MRGSPNNPDYWDQEWNAAVNPFLPTIEDGSVARACAELLDAQADREIFVFEEQTFIKDHGVEIPQPSPMQKKLRWKRASGTRQ